MVSAKGGVCGASEATLAFGPKTTAAGGRPLILWLQGYGGWGELAGTDNAGEISTFGGGAVFGIDMQVVPGWWAGLVVGSLRQPHRGFHQLHLPRRGGCLNRRGPGVRRASEWRVRRRHDGPRRMGFVTIPLRWWWW